MKAACLWAKNYIFWATPRNEVEKDEKPCSPRVDSTWLWNGFCDPSHYSVVWLEGTVNTDNFQ